MAERSGNALIALTGDVMLGRGVAERMRAAGILHPWGNTLDALRAADATIVNLECVISGGGRPWSRWPKAFRFRADPSAADSLVEAGVDCVTLANNHVLDYETDAFLEMLGTLESKGIRFTGAGRDLEEARRPAIVETPGLRIGVLAFTDNKPGWLANRTSPGTNWIPIGFRRAETIDPIRRAIAATRQTGAGFVIFTIHWGPNMVERPPELFREFARMVISLGADMFVGHSAHLFQGVELWGGRPIIYDAGDFVDDYAVDERLRNDWALLFRVEIENRSVRWVEFLPALIADCQVNFAAGEEREAIRRRFRRLCEEMDTHLTERDGSLFLGCPRPTPPPSIAPRPEQPSTRS